MQESITQPVEEHHEQGLSTEDKKTASKRATLGDHYSRHRAKLKANAQEEGTTESNSLIERATGLLQSGIQRITSIGECVSSDEFTAQITGIETKPELETNETPTVLEEEEVEQVRFELDGRDALTQWYTYEPSDPEHSLNKIIDFYANGDLTSLFYKTVRIVYIDDNPHITHPEPYDTRASHLRYKLYSLIENVFSHPERSTYAVVRTAKNDTALHPVNSTAQLTYKLRDKVVLQIASIPFALTTLLVLYSGIPLLTNLARPLIAIPSSPAPHPTQLLSFIAYAFATSVALSYCVGRAFKSTNGLGIISRGLTEGVINGLALTIVVPARVGMKSKKVLVSMKNAASSLIHRRLNQFNPYKQNP